MLRIMLASLLYLLLVTTTSATQNDLEDLAKQSQNPVADLISLPFQNNTNFNIGPYNRTQNILDIQPVIPLHITENWNLITRVILPVIHQPNVFMSSGSTNGVGDLNPTLFLSPRAPGKLIWGVGPVLLFPTATNRVLGNGKWGVGPSVVLLSMPGHWVIGVLANNIWSVAGQHDRPDVNQFLMQYFINYNLPKGWYVNSSPIITSDWNASAGNRWTVPFGAGFGKIFKMGHLPINAGVQGFYNAWRPQGEADWQLRLQVTLLFPT